MFEVWVPPSIKYEISNDVVVSIIKFVCPFSLPYFDLQNLVCLDSLIVQRKPIQSHHCTDHIL